MSEIGAMIEAGQLPTGTYVAQLAQALLIVADHDSDYQHAGGRLGKREVLLEGLLPYGWRESTALVVDRYENIVFNLDAAYNEVHHADLRIQKMAQDLGMGLMPIDLTVSWRAEYARRAEVWRGEAAVTALQAAQYEHSLRLLAEGALPRDDRPGPDEQGAQA